MHGEDILISFHHKNEALLADRLCCPVNPIERAALVEQPVVGGVDVFGGTVGCCVRQAIVDTACTETRQHLFRIVDREDNAAAHRTESIGHEGRSQSDPEVEPGGREFAVAGGGGQKRGFELTIDS